jgi:hypothetical protein
MRRNLDPRDVARRLATLRAMYVAETVDEGRARLRAEAMSVDAFATSVARRLDELRALDDLTRYLHAAGGDDLVRPGMATRSRSTQSFRST